MRRIQIYKVKTNLRLRLRGILSQGDRVAGYIEETFYTESIPNYRKKNIVNIYTKFDKLFVKDTLWYYG